MVSRNKKARKIRAFLEYGAPGEIRTPDRSVRSRVLYPAELQALYSELKFYEHLPRLTSLIYVFTAYVRAHIA